jgi:hypothetical protein
MLTVWTVHLHVRDFATRTPLHFPERFCHTDTSTLLREILQHGSKSGALFSLFADSSDLKGPVGKQSRMNITINMYYGD